MQRSMIGNRQPSDDVAYWLALHRAPGLGSAGFRGLVEQFSAPQAVLEASPSALAALGVEEAALAYLKAPDWSAVDRDLAWLAEPGNHLVTLASPDYPLRLRQIADPPPLLFVQGDPEVLKLPQLAIVGSRNPTPAGRETAFVLAKALAGAGLTITGGLAQGIDAAGHRGALAEDGLTIAVAGCGPDQIYPARHRDLAQEIATRGALVSEFPSGVPPLAANFPRRNRIISGLSLGVLVVEAARRSGSLITARLAAEQGREVFAIPGSIHNPLARGCHILLRHGAKLVESAADVLEEIGSLVVGSVEGQSVGMDERREWVFGLDEDYLRLLENMGYDPTSVDVLVERTGLTAEVVSSMLLLLELRGYVSPASGGLYCRALTRE